MHIVGLVLGLIASFALGLYSPIVGVIALVFVLIAFFFERGHRSASKTGHPADHELHGIEHRVYPSEYKDLF